MGGWEGSTGEGSLLPTDSTGLVEALVPSGTAISHQNHKEHKSIDYQIGDLI